MTKALRVLYVEDDEMVGMATLPLFEEYFSEVFWARNGQEGLDLYKKETPDLIITDIRIPVMDGMEMIRKIRKQDCEIPIVIFSAHSDIDYFQNAIEEGINGYLLKPLDLQRFEVLMERAVRKIRKKEQLQHYLQQQTNKADFDQLTGLGNRYKTHALFEQLQHGSKAGSAVLSVAIVDIDHFKCINDTYGHLTGDVVLQEMAKLFAHAIHEPGYVGRWGGEEFILFFPHTSLAEARTLLAQIKERIEVHSFGIEEKITISAGIAECIPSDTLNTVVQRADRVLYLAKNCGRNCIKGENDG